MKFLRFARSLESAAVLIGILTGIGLALVISLL
jgi:hypothetical protein